MGANWQSARNLPTQGGEGPLPLARADASAASAAAHAASGHVTRQEFRC